MDNKASGHGDESRSAQVSGAADHIDVVQECVVGMVPSDVAVSRNCEGASSRSSDLLTEEAAATEVQRLYRGYRTRRHLADIVVMAEKFGWWDVVEAAMLKHSSEQYYAFNKPETARTRWARIKRKAAKVGRGLAKDGRARKLAFQHWLEAIDARHRYGHNLHPYYELWVSSSTHEPFFYWLDVGEGKDLDLSGCPRSILNKEQIKYLSPRERVEYEISIRDGKLYFMSSGEVVDTPKGERYIFVMSASGKMYIAQKVKGRFQHSSFLAGGAALAAGRLLVNNGTLELIEAHSGHYRPTEENFTALVEILTKRGADLTMAKVQTCSDDMLSSAKQHTKQTCLDEAYIDEQLEDCGGAVQDDISLVSNSSALDPQGKEEEAAALADPEKAIILKKEERTPITAVSEDVCPQLEPRQLSSPITPDEASLSSPKAVESAIIQAAADNAGPTSSAVTVLTEQTGVRREAAMSPRLSREGALMFSLARLPPELLSTGMASVPGRLSSALQESLCVR